MKGTQVINDKKLKYCNSDGEMRPLEITDLNIVYRNKKGETVEEDTSCDSEYMLSAMRRVAEAMREKFHWLKKEEEAYLVMDQAGGHGTNKAIKEYTRFLKDEYNITIIHQVPRSPYTNVLDLGVWCALQSRVEKKQRGKRCEKEALAQSVFEVWNSDKLDNMINNVFTRLTKVLVLIIDGEGKNDLVEDKRGKKFKNLDDWKLPPRDEVELAIKKKALENDNIVDMIEDDDDDEDEDEDNEE